MIERWAKSVIFASEARRHPHAPTKAYVQTQLLGNRNRHPRHELGLGRVGLVKWT